MISIAIPRATSSEFIDEVFRGIFDLADRNGVSIVGGDTSSSPGPLMIDTSAIGECPGNRAITRGGARAGDTIYVTGSLGASMLGLALLEQGYRLEDCAQLAAEVAGSVMRRQALLRHLAPIPQLKYGRAIGEAQVATAMIDISDGLSTDLWRMLDESSCGAVIRADAIPVADYVLPLSDGDPLGLALHGGEEYELLFTARPEDAGRVSELSKATGVRVTAIGQIVSEKGLQLERDGALEQVPPSGYEHEI